MKHPNESKILPSDDPTIIPAILATESGIYGDDGDDDGGDGDGDCVVNDDGSDVGSKSFVHIYSLLLLISSNKISLSVD